MDLQPHLEYDPALTNVLNYGGFLLPSDKYHTLVNNFPATHCNWHWDLKGHFFLSYTVYQDAKRVAGFHSECVSESGFFDINLAEMLSFYDEQLEGLVVIEYYHPKTIPPDLYFSHIHKHSQSYSAYPALPFAGDVVHDPQIRVDQLENALFWPGVINNEAIKTSVKVVNPYKIPFQYQVSLYRNNHVRVQTGVLKVNRRSVATHSIDELFPQYCDELASSKGDFSVCVSSQFKVLAYAQIESRKLGIVTTIDHFHRFCMY